MNGKKIEETAGKLRFGTAVFVLRLPGRIIVAADSRQVDGNGKILSDEICKIRKFGSGYLVVNGAVGDSGSEYDFFRIMGETADETRSLSANTEALAAVIKPLLTTEANRLKIEDEDSFRRNMQELPPLGFCVVGIVNNTPFFITKRFSVVDPLADVVTLNIQTDYCPQEKESEKGLYLVGPAEVNDKLHADFPALRNPNKPLTISSVKIARLFMQRVINAGVEKVGGPIDILTLTAADGFVWVAKKDNCADV